jgi:hypothetical protein
MDERAIRLMVVDLTEQLRDLTYRASLLYRTSGWVATADELPEPGRRVLVIHYSGPEFAEYNGEKWTYYGGANVYETSHAPKWWMVVPPDPDSIRGGGE